MSDFPGLFESIATDDSQQRLASRKALVVARERLDQRLGGFLGASQTPEEFDARLEYAREDFDGIVNVTAAEFGHDDPASLNETLQQYFREAAVTKEAPGKDHLPGASDKRNRQYEHIKDSYEASGSSEDEAKELAARTVNKERSEHGETKSAKDDKKDKKNVPPWLKGKGHGDDDDEDESSPETEKSEKDTETLSFGASASDAVPLAPKTADAQNNTGLSETPSPKMKKERWTPTSIGEPDTGDDAEKSIDPTVALPKKNEGPPGDISNIEGIRGRPNKGEWEHQELPTASGAENLDDAGFNAEKNTGTSGPTKTFGDGKQADPVDSSSPLETVSSRQRWSPRRATAL